MIRAALIAVGVLLAVVPGARAAELQAAYEHYVPGQGFQIGLINAATGAARPLPAGVNTTDDELHPALSPDGRWLVFTRMRILPKLDGTFVVPTQQSLFLVDLQAQTVAPLLNGLEGSGATFMTDAGPGRPIDLAWGIRPQAAARNDGTARVAGATAAANLPDGNRFDLGTDLPATSDVFIPHFGLIRIAFRENLLANTICTPTCSAFRDIRYMTIANFDPTTGAFGGSRVRMQVFGPPDNASTMTPVVLKTQEIGSNGQPAGHVVARTTDQLVAMHRNTGGPDADIHSMEFPLNTSTTAAPAPINTTSDERMPAWSPDGLQLGFVRTVNGRRQLGIYDLTPGLQTIVNGLVDIGADAPTSATRVFQGVWGGLSLAAIPAAPAVTCDLSCIARLRGVGVLTPVVTGRSKIGIFIVKRTGGTRTVLGVKQPRIKFVARVPLGTAKQGRNRFELKRRLKPGKYLLTYRLLKGDKVTSVSKSIPLTVRK